VLRGSAEIDTWAPSQRADPEPDLVARLAQLYAADPPLAAALARARALRESGAMHVGTIGAGDAAGAMRTAATAAPARQTPVVLARQAAAFLARPEGPQVAVLELGGWDSHANQVADTGPLVANLRLLDATLAALRDGLTDPAAGDAWARSVVLVVTEFGRTVAINGTQGTDHGSGGAALALGGAVRGGQVIADWPGLAPAQRLDGRDLRITTDLRALFKTVLIGHLGLDRRRVTDLVLPGSASLAALPLLKG
jgi:uncharacterized protein (DUF1501 family)